MLNNFRSSNTHQYISCKKCGRNTKHKTLQEKALKTRFGAKYESHWTSTGKIFVDHEGRPNWRQENFREIWMDDLSDLECFRTFHECQTPGCGELVRTIRLKESDFIKLVDELCEARNSGATVEEYQNALTQIRQLCIE